MTRLNLRLMPLRRFPALRARGEPESLSAIVRDWYEGTLPIKRHGEPRDGGDGGDGGKAGGAGAMYSETRRMNNLIDVNDWSWREQVPPYTSQRCWGNEE